MATFHGYVAPDGLRPNSQRRTDDQWMDQGMEYSATPTASAIACTRLCTDVSTPRASTSCWSSRRNTAAMTVETGTPRPPSSEVPASTTTATDGSSNESPWNAVGW